MKKRFTNERIIGGRWRHSGQGIVTSTRFFECLFYTDRGRFAGMPVSDAKRLQDLEAENAQLKKLLAESLLDAEALKVALGRKH
ncbi:putative transposase [Nitrosospira multiformis]|nr:putative transposase [Nitrosospira multiformis]